jgi:uncharacterized coiled-coil protein SlyX
LSAPLVPFGLDLSAVFARFDHLEELMATEAEQITALSTKLDDVIADVRAALAILTAERDNLGTEGQAALDSLSAKLAAFDTEIGDADGSDTPPTP